MSKARQSHRNRIDKDDFVARYGKLPHEVSFRVGMVIPPVFSPKADYRTVAQHLDIFGVHFGVRWPGTALVFGNPKIGVARYQSGAGPPHSKEICVTSSIRVKERGLIHSEHMIP